MDLFYTTRIKNEGKCEIRYFVNCSLRLVKIERFENVRSIQDIHKSQRRVLPLLFEIGITALNMKFNTIINTKIMLAIPSSFSIFNFFLMFLFCMFNAH